MASECDRERAYSISYPRDMVTTSEGTFIEADVDVYAEDEKAASDHMEHLRREHGFLDKLPGVRSSRSFGFTSTHWNAPWEPKGPKPNWVQDKPSLN